MNHSAALLAVLAQTPDDGLSAQVDAFIDFLDTRGPF